MADQRTPHPDAANHGAPGFDTSNRAYQRFLAVIAEHFEPVHWQRENGDPIFTTLIDLSTGDSFSVRYLDTAQDTTPAIVLAADSGDALSAYGPLPGRATAASYAPIVALSDPDVVATTTLPLHSPAQPITDATWGTIPAALARTATAASGAGPADQSVIVLLLDAPAERILAVGPFDDATTAGLGWIYDNPRGIGEHRPLIIPIRTTRATSA